MPSISREEAAHLAHLARLDLSAQELDHLSGQLDAIVEWVAQVSEVAADDIPPTSHPAPLTNVFREDVVEPSLGAAAVLAGAPASEDDRFRVPQILGEEQ